jgi:hypothetical protein
MLFVFAVAERDNQTLRRFEILDAMLFAATRF